MTRSQAEGGEPAVDKQQEDKNGSFFGRLGGFFAGAPIRSPDGSVSSGSGSVKSAIARRNAALAQVAGFKEEKKQQVYQCELELNDLEADLCEMEDKLDTANKKLVALDPCAQDEESTALKEECQQLKKSIRLKTLQVQRKKIKLRKIQDEIEELPEQKKLLESVLDEMEEQTLSDEDDQAEVRKEWAEKRLSLPSVSKSYDDLVQRFTQLQQPFRIDEEVKASREMEKSLESKEKGDHQDGDSNKDPMAEALKSIASILKTQQVQQLTSSSSTEKFIARQSHSKDLPFFSGKPEEWPSFISDFKRTTEVCGYTKSENLTRLRKCLKGDALDSVRCMMISPESVPDVMKTLEARFGQSRHIVASLIQKVKKVQPVKEEKLESVIEFGTAVANLISIIKALDQKDQLHNPSLLLELESKLSSALKMQWGTWIIGDGQRKQDLIHFADWIQEKTKVAYAMCPVEVKDDKQFNGRFQQQRNKQSDDERIYSADTSEVKNQKSSSKNCVICDKSGHVQRDCFKFKKMTISDRRQEAMKKRLCYNCLGIRHDSRNCRSSQQCGVDGCKSKHHCLLHISSNRPVETKAESTSESVESVHSFAEPSSSKTGGRRGILGIVKVKLSGPKGTTEVYALVDPGSTTGLIDEKVANQIGLKGPSISICIKGVKSTSATVKSRLVNLNIAGCYAGAKTFKMDFVKTLPDLDLGPFSLNVEQIQNRNNLMCGLPINSYNNVKPMLLIGSDHTFLTEHLKIVSGKPNEARAYKSRLGWYVSGATSGGKYQAESVHHVCAINDFPVSPDQDAMMNDLIKQSFSTEDFGVKIVNAKPRSREDERAMQIMEVTTKKIPSVDRYETGLLWKTDHVQLPDSYPTALGRLRCQERKMDKDPVFATAYCNKIQEYEDKQFIRKLSEEELNLTKEVQPLWYLPHFGVMNPNKPGKLRLVFDAAAESNGVSLNSNLVQGPDLNNTIVSVLLKFRQYQYGFAGDVKDMFHRVMIQKKDRTAQRFLWRGQDRDRKPDVYELEVMMFGSSCSPSCAQFVKNKNAKQFSSENPAAVEAIISKFYVDDYLDSKATKGEACKMIQDVIDIQKKASFEVCNWVTNSAEVLKSIPEELRATDLKNLDFDNNEMPTGRLLGLWWNQEKDVMTFRLNFYKVPEEIIQGERRPTKREVLKLVMSIYDPLGFVAHYVIQGKILLQEIWRSGIGFDDTLTDNLDMKWKQFIEQLNNLCKVELPRCYSSLIPEARDIQLHIFCDASEKAFSCVVYLRVTQINAKEEDLVEVNLVLGKTRVSPMKTLSIPRLELQAAVMAVRVAKTLKEELEFTVHETIYWSDSTVVLCQIRNGERRFKTFVAHRIGEILETSDPSEWHWVPTKENVADDATRDSVEAELSPTSRWFNGPAFLKSPRSEWPRELTRKKLEEIDPAELELKVEVHVAEDATIISAPQISLELDQYDDLDLLLKNTVLIQRDNGDQSEPSVAELVAAKKYWIMRSQHESFSEDVKTMQGGKPLPRKSQIYKLSPFMEDGYLKMRSRVCDNSTYPFILDPRHKFTRLLIDDQHRKCGHQGRETVASELRQEFWILRMGMAIRKAFWDCLLCRKMRAKPVQPEMGDLPPVRLERNIHPFKNTGLDYFGPFNITIGRRSEKRWGALFTCLSTRAVHLEIAGSLSTDSAIMAIIRFSRRRGAPENIYCDNGTNFRGAANELKQLLDELNQEEIHRKLAPRGVQWHFSPPAGPHMGGVWERLVGSVKKVLNGLLWHTTTKEETIHTLFTEVEWTLNSRPLTHVSVDPADPQPITPNHFLIGWRNGAHFNSKNPVTRLQLGEFDDHDLSCRKQWRRAQRMADVFWTRWTKEYLPTLAKRNKWNKSEQSVEVGDIVVVVDDQAPRNSWMQGRIEAVFPGKDGVVRVATVKTDDGHTYRRPVVKLCVLTRSTDEAK